MENLLFLGVPIFKHIRVFSNTCITKNSTNTLDTRPNIARDYFPLINPTRAEPH